MLDITKP